MAGTTVSIKRAWGLATESGQQDPLGAMYAQINNIITDLETLRAGARGFYVQYEHEDLSADADIAARPIFEARFAGTITSVRYIPRANSSGIDGSNTAIITLRNITEGVNVATVTRTTNVVAGTPVDITITGDNADIASGDVLGLTITQGSAADLAAGILQFEIKGQSVDAAGDLIAAALSTVESGD
jgi:hypothetical protein